MRKEYRADGKQHIANSDRKTESLRDRQIGRLNDQTIERLIESRKEVWSPPGGLKCTVI